MTDLLRPVLIILFSILIVFMLDLIIVFFVIRMTKKVSPVTGSTVIYKTDSDTTNTGTIKEVRGRYFFIEPAENSGQTVVIHISQIVMIND